MRNVCHLAELEDKMAKVQNQLAKLKD